MQESKAKKRGRANTTELEPSTTKAGKVDAGLTQSGASSTQPHSIVSLLGEIEVAIRSNDHKKYKEKVVQLNLIVGKDATLFSEKFKLCLQNLVAKADIIKQDFEEKSSKRKKSDPLRPHIERLDLSVMIARETLPAMIKMARETLQLTD